MGNILALYDCRSKQEYIYRTNKIREISGGSNLLSEVYERFIKKAQEEGIKFNNGGQWEGLEFSIEKFSFGSEFAAEVVYTGGGNLMVIYKDRDVYIRANRIFSRMLLDETCTITAIVSCTEVSSNFLEDRDKLYAENALKKSTGYVSMPCSVLPFTQVDMQTYMPVAEKQNGISKSRESVCKLNAYDDKQDNELSSPYLDDLVTEKGKESLLAIIYIDGNNMGAKLMQALGEETGYNKCINALRSFSAQTNNDFVDTPIKAIEKMLRKKQKSGIGYAKYRKVIAGGDEITLICNARIVPDILDTYFKALNSIKSGNYACAGVAVFHSHAPFADVYEIAEQCCESGKKQSRQYGSNANFIDFHFCRAGITNDMDTVRSEQENGLTARPYREDAEHNGYSYSEFIRLGKMLAGSNETYTDNENKKTYKDNGIGRANVKNLATELIKSRSSYKFEMLRIRSRLNKDNPFDKELLERLDPDSEALEKLIFDIAQVYDLWFDGKEETEAEKNEG